MDLFYFVPGIATILLALLIMFRLMHYAHFYAPSYFFWIGAILALAGASSLVEPLAFLFISSRAGAACVLAGGVVISIGSLLWPVPAKKSHTTDQQIDDLLPIYSFNELHTVRIKTSAEKIKNTLHETGVKDIPVIHLLMKIRGIADENVDMSDRASKSICGTDTFETPDFNFFVLAPEEFVTLMILKTSMLRKDASSAPPPEVNSTKEFLEFGKPGYVKVAMNFRFEPLADGETLVSTETRVHGTGRGDSQRFGRYWRIIYPGSAIIRRVWLDTIKRKAEAVLR